MLKGEKMRLSELNMGDSAIIQKIATDEELKSRLYSFGVGRGSELFVEACSIGKQTIGIIVDDTFIGLRSEEAKEILVKRVV